MRAAIIAVATAVTLCAGSGGALAQVCIERAGEGTGSTKEAALRVAYEAVLRAVDSGLWRAWSASNQRIGEAPGHTVRKLTSTCTPPGASQTCRITATLCRN